MYSFFSFLSVLVCFFLLAVAGPQHAWRCGAVVAGHVQLDGQHAALLRHPEAQPRSQAGGLFCSAWSWFLRQLLWSFAAGVQQALRGIGTSLLSQQRGGAATALLCLHRMVLLSLVGDVFL